VDVQSFGKVAQTFIGESSFGTAYREGRFAGDPGGVVPAVEVERGTSGRPRPAPLVTAGPNTTKPQPTPSRRVPGGFAEW